MAANHLLRDWRIANNLTLDEAGARVGVTGTAFGKYELGHRYPRPTILAAILRMTGGAVPADAFVPSEQSDPPLEAAE